MKKVISRSPTCQRVQSFLNQSYVRKIYLHFQCILMFRDHTHLVVEPVRVTF